MAFGIYVHIPYCLQLCPYCDFTKYEWGKTLAPSVYTELLLREIRQRASDVPKREIDTVYFGGGTPSLLEPSLILAILREIEKAGFRRSPQAEITIEIDPATVDEAKLDSYLEMGINRFSVGAQTFNERLLKIAGRKHAAQDTVELLSLLKRKNVNYSFDLLFALPTQSLEEVRADVATALAFDPSHLSAYCLTVPEGHKLDVGRAPEEDQVEMFDVIESTLAAANIHRYEISNFAKRGFESRHNMLYWTDQPYWGIGLSSHSYFPPKFSASVDEAAPWGARFWNTRAMKKYNDSLIAEPAPRAVSDDAFRFVRDLNEEQIETLQKHQALTDYCHTSLRIVTGLDENALRLKFGDATSDLVVARLRELEASAHLLKTDAGWAMSRQGRLVANLVFEKLTFLAGEAESEPSDRPKATT